MTKLVCNRTNDPLHGMDYTLSKDARIFLDKIDSSLVSRSGKECHWYESALSNLRNPEIIKYEHAYNEKSKYFIMNAGIKGIEWRTHPDLISYIEETDQKEFKIMDVQEGKVFTEFPSEIVHDSYMMIISDGPITIA